MFEKLLQLTCGSNAFITSRFYLLILSGLQSVFGEDDDVWAPTSQKTSAPSPIRSSGTCANMTNIHNQIEGLKKQNDLALLLTSHDLEKYIGKLQHRFLLKI